jgi:hypothetical protein
VFVGSVSQSRPAVLWVVRKVPSLLTRLMWLRALGLRAVETPVAALVFVVAWVLQVPLQWML